MCRLGPLVTALLWRWPTTPCRKSSCSPRPSHLSEPARCKAARSASMKAASRIYKHCAIRKTGDHLRSRSAPPGDTGPGSAGTPTSVTPTSAPNGNGSADTSAGQPGADLTPAAHRIRVVAADRACATQSCSPLASCSCSPRPRWHCFRAWPPEMRNRVPAALLGVELIDPGRRCRRGRYSLPDALSVVDFQVLEVLHEIVEVDGVRCRWRDH